MSPSETITAILLSREPSFKYDLSGFLYDNRHKGKYSMLNFDTSDTTSQILSASRALSILSDTAETDVDKKFIAVNFIELLIGKNQQVLIDDCANTQNQKTAFIQYEF